MVFIKIKLLIIGVFITTIHLAQNLVLNPSFENYCGKYPCYWLETSGTPDVFTKNKLHRNYKLHLYNEFLGATKGHVFVGVFSGPTRAGEGIQGTLKQTLDSGRVYNVKLYAIAYRFCSVGFRSIKVGLLDSILPKTIEPFYYKFKSINLYTKDSSIIKPKEPWVEFSSQYIAKGNEKYIYVSGQTDTIKTALKMGCAMKYFDSVIVEPTLIIINHPITIDSVFFETGKATILFSSYLKLNKLILFLNQNRYSKIKVNGHTDTIGLQSNNIILSQKRAQAVVNYLAGHGIDKNRLIAKGFGASKPIADNNTEDGRAKNRRIEVEFVEFMTQ